MADIQHKDLTGSDLHATGLYKVVGPAGTSGNDYTCDGTADNVEIQAAINAAAAAGGGTVLIRRGTYSLAAGLTLTSNLTLCGEGRGATILKAAAAWASGDMLLIGSNVGT